MQRWPRFGLAIIMASSLCSGTLAQGPDHALQVYAVHVVKTTPFEKPFTGYGIYLGKGAIITAFHVLGRWAFLKNPRVLVAGLDLPAKVLKEGSLDEVDLTLLSVDEARLPVALRLRRNPLCKQPPRPGQPVIAVAPIETARSEIVSPLVIAPPLRRRYNTLTGEVAEASGSGIFDAQRRCLLGIMSKRIPKYSYRDAGGKIVAEPSGYAGYFVPAADIAKFVPAEARF